MLRQGTWLCPTIAPYYDHWAPENTPGGRRDRKRAEVHEPSFKKALAAGVKIVFGTDMGGTDWSKPEAQEFDYMVKFGMSPMDAIRSATSRAADMLDMKGEIGVLASGAYADVIAVRDDPLANIHELHNVRFVMHNGAVFKNEMAK
jgi:imidazolonepropionase-like amidohydrolase